NTSEASDWSSDVCSSVLELLRIARAGGVRAGAELPRVALVDRRAALGAGGLEGVDRTVVTRAVAALGDVADAGRRAALAARGLRSEERRVGKECGSRGTP